MTIVLTPSAPPPTPGAAAPGNLYADSASQTLWLGVRSEVNPQQSLLVSDLAATLDAIEDALTTAKAYTDTGVATRAPTIHTHTANQITDFDAAVNAVLAGTPSLTWVPGMVMEYSGNIIDIGSGALAGWHLCDGSNLSMTTYANLFNRIGHTYDLPGVPAGSFSLPDLRSRFIVGAGHLNLGVKNPLTQFNTGLGGAHTPIVQNTTLTLAQIPSHSHSVSGTGAGYTDTAPAHTHSLTYLGGSGNLTYAGFAGGYAQTTQQTGGAGSHNHGVTVSSISGTAAAAGSGGAHTHGVNAVPDHSHVVTDQNLRDALPYVALAYMIRIS